MAAVYEKLPEPNHLDSIPGIGTATAAVLTAKMVDCERFPTPSHLVSYFGIFPEEDASGVDKDGQAKPGRHSAHVPPRQRPGPQIPVERRQIRHRAQPGGASLVQALACRGTRGDVALGHCMRKLLHLVFAVWKTGKPFDPEHYPWDTAKPAKVPEKTAGHNQDTSPERPVVTAVASTVTEHATPDKPGLASASPAAAETREPSAGGIDYAALRGASQHGASPGPPRLPVDS